VTTPSLSDIAEELFNVLTSCCPDEIKDLAEMVAQWKQARRHPYLKMPSGVQSLIDAIDGAYEYLSTMGIEQKDE